MTNHSDLIKQRIQNSIEVKSLLIDGEIMKIISDISSEIINCYKFGGKVLFCGNGGSAADAQHLAAELSGRFYKDREPLFAESLSVNSSYLTAVANDYSFDVVYSRLVKAFGKPGDILIGISTSGNSPNVVNAIEVANSLGMTTVSFTGSKESKLSQISNFVVKVPSTDTPRIQECHILIGHIICEIVEFELFK
jgi:D-sedoheptulose 7-phosphate isomerase